MPGGMAASAVILFLQTADKPSRFNDVIKIEVTFINQLKTKWQAYCNA